MPERQRILIVDDAPSNVKILNDFLSAQYAISVATDGVEALDIVSKTAPDLILLDIMMPGMDGYEVCRRLKKDERLQEIPVIFVTALDSIDSKIYGFGLGAVDYITKPFELAEVSTRVRTHLALKKARETLKRQNEELLQAARLREDVERMSRHDLKNPLTFIISLPDFLLEADNLTEQQKKDIKEIQDAGYRMLDLINRSLDLFKMERGIYKFKPGPVHLLKITDRVIADLQNIFDEKKVRAKVTVNGDTPGEDNDFIVLGEELLCYSLLADLIKNAVEASQVEDQVEVSFLDEGNSGLVRIHNPAAVPESIRDRFFDKYVTFGKDSGTGLGTYTARLMCKTQGGDIDMETSKRHGTTVTVCMPKWIRPVA